MIYTIPLKFEIAGQTIEVKYQTDLLNTEECHGVVRYRENTINLQEPNDSCFLPEDKIKQVFLHEVIHWILFQMGHTHLNQDEAFVDMFASFLYQVLKSSEGSLDGYRNHEPESTEGCDCNTLAMRDTGYFPENFHKTPWRSA